LNPARQTGSVVGVALFGSLIARSAYLMSGLHLALAISAGLALTVIALSARIGKARS
jgi:DHA2 family methylenomycin A resistance protein-like MFS transporter